MSESSEMGGGSAADGLSGGDAASDLRMSANCSS